MPNPAHNSCLNITFQLKGCSETRASTPKLNAIALQSPLSERRSITKLSHRYVTTPPKPKLDDCSMLNGRPRRRASVKSKINSYKESPEVLDISSDGGHSDNFDPLQHSSSQDKSDSSADSSDSLQLKSAPASKISKLIRKERNKKSRVNCSKNERMQKPTKSSSNNTPGRRKEMTPRIPSRTIPLPNMVSPLQEAQMRLHVAAVPECLPCREEEFYEVLAFTEGKIIDGTGGCMYISGLPGNKCPRQDPKVLASHVIRNKLL